MHNADQHRPQSKAAPCETVMMFMPVRVYSGDQLGSQYNKHCSDGEFESIRKPLRYRNLQTYHDQPGYRERDRVSQAPEQTDAACATKLSLFAQESCDCNDVIGIGRMF